MAAGGDTSRRFEMGKRKIFNGIDIAHMTVEDADNMGKMYKRGLYDGIVSGARWCLDMMRAQFGDTDRFRELECIVDNADGENYDWIGGA